MSSLQKVLNGVYLTETIVISNTDIKGAGLAPFQLGTAPASGYFRNVIDIKAKSDFTIAWTNVTAVNILYGTDTANPILISAGQLISNYTSGQMTAFTAAGAGMNTVKPNVALFFWVPMDISSDGGDGTITLYITYQDIKY